MALSAQQIMWVKEIFLLIKAIKFKTIFTLFILALIPYTSFASTNFALKSKPPKPSSKIYSEKQQQEIALAESYLNSINNLSANFIQIDENGKVQKGKFYLSRPEKMRCEYNDPKEILIILNGKDVVYFDKKLDHISYFRTRNDFINLITKPRINLKEEKIFVKKIQDLNNQITLSLGKEDSQETFTIIFTKEPFEAKKLKIIDSSGNHIDFTFHNTKQPSSLEPSLFEFTEHKYLRK